MNEPTKGWRHIEGIAGIFAHVVGKRVVRRETEYKNVPSNPRFNYTHNEFEAVEFDDGSWLAIEHSPGSAAWSEFTPAELGYTYVYLLTP